eukprot:6193563-Pleurochrysis_carterae.AAC.1
MSTLPPCLCSCLHLFVGSHSPSVRPLKFVQATPSAASLASTGFKGGACHAPEGQELLPRDAAQSEAERRRAASAVQAQRLSALHRILHLARILNLGLRLRA